MQHQPAGNGTPRFVDITLTDQETGEPFVFTAKEQEFYAKQGFTHVPKRSPARRKELEQQRYKGKPLFNVTCVRCKKVGKVLVEPADLGHVLCEDCFIAEWNRYAEQNPGLNLTPLQPALPPEALPQA